MQMTNIVCPLCRAKLIIPPPILKIIEDNILQSKAENSENETLAVMEEISLIKDLSVKAQLEMAETYLSSLGIKNLPVPSIRKVDLKSIPKEIDIFSHVIFKVVESKRLELLKGREATN